MPPLSHGTFHTSCSLFSVLVIGLVVVTIPAWGKGGGVIYDDIKLLANNIASRDQFGYSIAKDNGFVAVGSFDDDDNDTDSGSAYIFDASTGKQIDKLIASDGSEGDFFGWSIAIANNIIVAGAAGDDDNGTDSGSAYVFDASECKVDFNGDLTVDVLDYFEFINYFGVNCP